VFSISVGADVVDAFVGRIAVNVGLFVAERGVVVFGIVDIGVVNISGGEEDDLAPTGWHPANAKKNTIIAIPFVENDFFICPFSIFSYDWPIYYNCIAKLYYVTCFLLFRKKVGIKTPSRQDDQLPDRTPHGSRRAVFPHRALHEDSLPQPYLMQWERPVSFLDAQLSVAIQAREGTSSETPPR
jgi:hypothetical protein